MIPLLPMHREHLRASGLTDATIEAAGICSCVDPREAANLLGWNSEEGPAPAIVFPNLVHGGEVAYHLLRPDLPRVREDGTSPKYESPVATPTRLYFPPAALVTPQAYLDGQVPLLLIEGIKKALCVAQVGANVAPISAQGVTVWHNIVVKQASGIWQPHPDLRSLTLNGRAVFIGFDGGDTTENPAVIYAEARNAKMLLDDGAAVRLLRPPFQPGGPKVGLDDYLSQQPDRGDALRRLLQLSLPASPIARARALADISDRNARADAAQRLVRDPSFAAAIAVADAATFDLVAEETDRAVGIKAKSLKAAIDTFEKSMLRQQTQKAAAQADGAKAGPYTEEVEAAAEVLLTDPNLLGRFLADLEGEGLVGEHDAALTILLSMVTRRQKKPIHIVIKAASSSGKNFITECVASRLPPEDLLVVTDMSPRALLYLEGSLKNKVIIINEQEGAERAEYTMRVAMTDGSLTIPVAEKAEDGDGQIRTRKHVVEGPACFITTTTRGSLHDENETRVLEVTLDESQSQTSRIVNHQALMASRIMSPEELRLIEHRRQVWRCALSKLTLTETVNRGALELVSQFPTKHVRARRDFSRLLGLAAAMAVLHQRQREVIDERFVVVSPRDVSAARELCDALFSNITPRIRMVSDKLRSNFADKEFTTAEAAMFLGYATDAARRLLGDIEAAELVKKTHESKGSKAARWQMVISAPPSSPSGARPAAQGTQAPAPIAPVTTAVANNPLALSASPTPADTRDGRMQPVETTKESTLSDRPTAEGSPGVPAPINGGTHAAVSQAGRSVGQQALASNDEGLRQSAVEVGPGLTVAPTRAGFEQAVAPFAAELVDTGSPEAVLAVGADATALSCRVCLHPERQGIERRMKAQELFTQIAARYGLMADEVLSHVAHRPTRRRRAPRRRQP